MEKLFTLPSGSTGQVFVAELARLFQSYAEKSTLEVIIFQVMYNMCMVMLQKPHACSKMRDHVEGG